MKVFLRAFSAAVVAGAGLVGAVRGQQMIVLENGDRLSGRLKTIDRGTWTFVHRSGEAKIAAASVADFTAPTPIGVRLADGTILAVTVTPRGGALRLSGTDGTSRTVAPLEIVAVGDAANLEALEPVRIGYFTPFDRFWGATASFGFSDKSGNSRSRGLSFALEAGRKSPKDRVTFKAGLAREEARLQGDQFETTVEKYYGSLRLDVFFGPTFFAFGVTGQERDRFQDIDLRSTYNAGLGYQIIATDLTDLRWFASGGLRVENFTSDGGQSTGVVATGAGFRQVLGPVVVSWTADWSPSVESFRDYRFVSDGSLTTTIYKGLGFRVGLRNEFNNNPRPGIQKHDMLWTTTLTYSVGQG